MKSLSFFDSIIEFREKFFNSYKRHSIENCEYYNWKIKNGVIFNPFEVKIIFKLVFNKFFKDKKILEIGCGAGQMAIFLNLFNIKVDVVELNKNFADLCKKIMEDFNVNFKIFNIQLTKIPKEIILNYDCIISGDCIHQVNNDLDKSLFIYKLFSLNKNKLILVNGGSFVDTQCQKTKMKSIFYFKNKEYELINKLNKFNNESYNRCFF